MKHRSRYQRYTRKDGTTSYVVDTRDASGKHVRRAFDRIEDADDFYEHTRRQRKRVKAGLERLIEPKLLKHFIDEWLKTRLEGKIVVYSTHVTEEQRFRRYVRPRLGHMQIHKIDSPTWEKTLSAVCDEFKLSPGTHDLIRANVRKLYQDAIRLGYAGTNPIDVVPTRNDRKKKSWTIWRSEGECLAYLKAASLYRSTWFYPMAFVALQTGAREGELIALRWDYDLDLTAGRIRIWQVYEKESKSIQPRTKGGEDRWVALNPSVIRLLEAYRASLPGPRAQPGALVFARTDGRPQKPSRVRKVHLKCIERAGVPRIRFHDLRHQYASLFAQRGGNQKALQGLLGHSSLTMTERYAHLDAEFLLSHSHVVEFEPIRVNYDAPRLPQDDVKRGLKRPNNEH